jgi:hypothetical protein
VASEPLRPAVALAQVLAVFEPGPGGARKGALQRRAQQADATARVEDAAHRQADVPRIGRDQARALAHLRARDHGGARIEIERR